MEIIHQSRIFPVLIYLFSFHTPVDSSRASLCCQPMKNVTNRRQQQTKKKEKNSRLLFKNNHGNSSERANERASDVTRKKRKNSHKIFIVMLATLLPCLFSTMHEYTPLSVRFSPLGNVKVGVVISTSSVSKRFQ